MTLNEMIDRYESARNADGYILGTIVNGKIYMTIINGSAPAWIYKEDNADGLRVIRFKPTKIERLKIQRMGMTYELTMDTAGKYNKGERFEKAVHEFFGQSWKKDNVAFFNGCDIELGGVKYEIKFENATFSNEKLLGRL